MQRAVAGEKDARVLLLLFVVMLMVALTRSFRPAAAAPHTLPLDTMNALLHLALGVVPVLLNTM